MTDQEIALAAIKLFADQAHRRSLALALGISIDGILRAEHEARPISQTTQEKLAEKVMDFLIDVDDLLRQGDAS